MFSWGNLFCIIFITLYLIYFILMYFIVSFHMMNISSHCRWIISYLVFLWFLSLWETRVALPNTTFRTCFSSFFITIQIANLQFLLVFQVSSPHCSAPGTLLEIIKKHWKRQGLSSSFKTAQTPKQLFYNIFTSQK